MRRYSQGEKRVVTGQNDQEIQQARIKAREFLT